MKVFIIDDEQISVFIARHKLILEGVARDRQIHTFLSAKEALEALSACEDEDLPDIVLLDLELPEMDGWQFLDMLSPFKARFEGKCRIYIVTSSLSLSDRAKASENPMVSGFISKPISIEDVGVLNSVVHSL